MDTETLTVLAANAERANDERTWPASSWEALRRAGVLQWTIPPQYGGQGLDGIDLLSGYEQLAAACLTTCFILSQREAACRRIRDQGKETLRGELLPVLASGERFATVGLSHLTTSRQHTAPAMTACDLGNAFVLNGIMPWVTGAERADWLVTGAVLEDKRQILLVLPRELPGVRVGPPLDLMALAGSLTAEVHCANVTVDRRWLLAGPAERVMNVGRTDAGGLETSCLALGLTAAATTYLRDESAKRPELIPSMERLENARLATRAELHRLVREGSTEEQAASLRGRVNTLVLRATQAALIASKGAGYLKNHPAQRWARQAMFFLVWSCPRPAVDATLEYLTGN